MRLRSYYKLCLLKQITRHCQSFQLDEIQYRKDELDMDSVYQNYTTRRRGVTRFLKEIDRKGEFDGEV
jgi:hypothetical protein